MTFYVGQKVVCVDAGPAGTGIWDELLEKGGVYTIRSIVPSFYGHDYLCCHLAEVKRCAPVPFRLSRFRPVVEKKTDISVFEEILRRETIDDQERVS